MSNTYQILYIWNCNEVNHACIFFLKSEYKLNDEDTCPLNTKSQLRICLVINFSNKKREKDSYNDV